MSRSASRFETAVETFENMGLSEREAQVFVVRKLAGDGRQEAAWELDLDPSTVDTLYQRAKAKDPKLPGIDHVRYPDTTNGIESKAASVYFENGAILRYSKYEREDGTVELVEETVGANDPHSVLDSAVVGGEGDNVAEFALNAISEYTRNYRDIDACRKDWTTVYEAITLHDAQ